MNEPEFNRKAGSISTTEEFTFLSSSEDETFRIGRTLGKLLHGGDFVALVGELGAGKTNLTKGLVAGLDFEYPDEVNSPTFVLINEYAASIQVYHIDAYRLHSGEELFSLGFEEMLQEKSVVIVEWADRVRHLVPSDGLWIEIKTLGEYRRELRIRSHSSRLMRDIGAASGLDQLRMSDDKTT